MKELFTRIRTEPELLVMPTLLGLAMLIGLFIILRLLERDIRSHPINKIYSVGSMILSLWVFLGQLAEASQTVLPTALVHGIQAFLLIFWCYILLELIEGILLARWTQRTGILIPRLARDIVRALAFIIVGLLVLALLFNIDPGSIAISSTVLSAVLGLALQDLLKNVIAGLALQIERPFEVGHWIQVDQVTGRVLEMNWRATHLMTTAGNFVIYPNAALAESTVFNHSLPTESQAVHVPIMLPNGYPPAQIKELLLTAMRSSAHVLEHPAPTVVLTSYTEKQLSYDLIFWLPSYTGHAEKRDGVLTNVWNTLKQAGIMQPPEG